MACYRQWRGGANPLRAATPCRNIAKHNPSGKTNHENQRNSFRRAWIGACHGDPVRHGAGTGGRPDGRCPLRQRLLGPLRSVGRAVRPVARKQVCPGDTESPFLAFSINNSQYYTSRASQPIGNSFTNGVVEYWVDMRAPGKWGNTSSMPYLRFIPIYRTYLQTPDNTVNPPVAYPAMLGPCNLTGSAATASTTRCFGGSQYNGDLGVVSAADGGYVSLRTGWWYRYRLVVDFESHYVYYSVWELGANVPTWDTPAGENVMPQKRKYIYRPPTAETGPLDGIGFAVGGINSGNPSVVTNMAAVTNIRVGWKAHDADAEFIPCYSNDFRTCWRRSLADATTASAYAAPAGAGASEFSSYYANVNTTCPGSQVITGTTGHGAQPVGVDGWRRISETGAAHPSVANSGGDGANVLRVTKASGTASSAYWAVFGNSLGETITSGKVMFSVDVRTASRSLQARRKSSRKQLRSKTQAPSHSARRSS